MKQTTTLLRKALALTLLFFCALMLQAQTVVWQEDFEGDWTADWHVDAGTWEVGTPTSGPDSAYAGDNCAATILAGNYTEPVSSRLIRHISFTVPAKSENPRLRFWHWYTFSTRDYGKVQVKVDGTDDWVDISTSYTSTGGHRWTYPSIDLSDYAGQTVQIAFYFYSLIDGSSHDVSSGWYIDDVEVITGDIVFKNPEDWENGMGDWTSERGTWEVGVPTSGPGSAYTGKRCAATILEGDYTEPVSSKLISPIFLVPSASENPRLRFWHWYSFSTRDYGNAQIKVVGTSDWINIPTAGYTGTSGNVWTYTYLPLSDYAGQSVQIAFYFYSLINGSSHDVSSGWYIDDVVIEPYVPTGTKEPPLSTNASVLQQNSPNPFSSSTQIAYSVQKPGLVSLLVYDSSGAKVGSLVNAVQPAGEYTVGFEAGNLPSGIYLYALQIDNTIVATKKMLIVK